jgi:hypothetical protein
MHHSQVREILGEPDERTTHLTDKAWIPFYSGPDRRLTEWVYNGIGRVVFSADSAGKLFVYDAVYDPDERK